jgi:drug/metabolite transporter (DMT)-like permease
LATGTPSIISASSRVGRLPAYLALAAGVICISWSAIFVRWTDIPGPASAFYRLLIPALVLWPTSFFRRTKSRLSSRNLGIIALGGLFFALDLALYNTSVLRTTAANATVLGNFSPVFVGLVTWLLFRRRTHAAFWLGLLLALSGSVLIVWADLAGHQQFGIGDLMALGAGACFAVYLMATEEVRAHSSTLVFLRLAMLSSTLALLLINLVLGISLNVPNGRTWAALLGLGLFTQLGGYLALTYALGHLPATITSISLLIQVPLTALLAVILFRETLTLPQITGALLVLAGVALAHRRQHPEDEANL